MSAGWNRVDASAVRELYDALMAARVYVARCADELYVGENTRGRGLAANVLERVDGALADAGDVLARTSSGRGGGSL